MTNKGTRNGALLIFIYLMGVLMLIMLVALMISHNIRPGFGLCLAILGAGMVYAVRILDKDNNLC